MQQLAYIFSEAPTLKCNLNTIKEAYSAQIKSQLNDKITLFGGVVQSLCIIFALFAVSKFLIKNTQNYFFILLCKGQDR
jgi:hypothetical protein